MVVSSSVGTKRKRHSSHVNTGRRSETVVTNPDRDATTTTTTRSPSSFLHPNPFLPPPRIPFDHDMDDTTTTTTKKSSCSSLSLLSLFDHVSSLASSCGSSNHHHETLPNHSTEDSLAFIVQYLQQQPPPPPPLTINDDHHHHHHVVHNILSHTEIIQVVVSWCLTHVQQQQQQQQQSDIPTDTIWDALNVSLPSMSEVVVVDTPPSIITTASLHHTTTTTLVLTKPLVTQSSLFKIIPKMIQWMMIIMMMTTTTSDTTGHDESIPTAAAVPKMWTTYQLLLSMFQPTMEVACKHVLQSLVVPPPPEHCSYDNTTNNNTPHIITTHHHQRRRLLLLLLLRPTLRWIHAIHTSRKGNPKTTFSLFADRTVLSALAQCYSLLILLLMSPNNVHHDVENVTSDDEEEENRASVALLHELMNDIFFHPKHHMEGFMTILKQTTVPVRMLLSEDTDLSTTNSTGPVTSFKTYHYDLLDTIQTEIMLLPSPNDTDRRNHSESMQIILLLPLLFQGFVQQSNIYWKDRKGKANGSNDTTTTITKRQYQLFIRWTRPLLRTLQSWTSPRPEPASNWPSRHSTEIVSLLLSTIRNMLQVLLDQNVYTPTARTIANVAADHGERHSDSQLPLLPDIVRTIFDLKLLLVNRNDDDTTTTQTNVDAADFSLSSSSSSMKQNMIHTLQIIFQLHHTLLPDRMMMDALHLCLFDDSPDTTVEIGTDFIVTMITTYRQLRQQQLIFVNILAVVDELRATDSMSSSLNQIQYLIHSFTSKQKIVDALRQAMIHCPIEETKAIFHTCNDWMLQWSNDRNHGTEHGDSFRRHVVALGVMIPLLTTVTRNVRVVSSTAPVIATCCQLLIQNSITKLSQATNDENDSHGFMAHVIVLTGSLVELHMHCVFWLGRTEALTIPNMISDRIGLFETLYDQDTSQLYQSIIHLSCHRLKQLHSLIYEQEVASLERQVSNGDIIATLTTEAKRIAAFVSRQVDHINSNESYRWIAVAQNLSAWIAYAEKEDIIQFLKWVVLTASKSMRHFNTTSTQEPCQTLVSSKQSVDLYIELDETEVVKCLLADNAFFQQVQVGSLISMVGLSVVAELIEDVLRLGDRNSCDNIELRSFIDTGTPLTDDAYQRLERDTILNPDYQHKKVPLGVCASTETTLQQALNVAMLVVGFPTFSCSDEDAWNFFDLALRLDHVYLSLDAGATLLPTLALIATSARLLLTKVLKSSSVSSVQNMFIDYLPLCDLIFGLIDSTRNHLSRIRPMDTNLTSQVMESTGFFIEALLAKVEFDTDLAQQIAKGFSRVKLLCTDSSSTPMLVHLSRRIFLAIKRFVELPTQRFTPLIEEMWEVAIFSCEMEYKCPYSEFDNDRTLVVRPIVPFSLSEGFLLLGDLIDVKKSPSKDADRILCRLQTKCIVLLRQSLTTEIPILEWSSLCYLTGRIALKRPSMELTECILAAIQFEGHRTCNTQVLEACICQMVPTLAGDALLSVIGTLTSCSSKATARRLRLLQLILQYIHDLDAIELLSSVGRKMFMFSLSGLCHQRGDLDWRDTVVAACAVLEYFIKRRDLLSVKERDLALILSYISGIVGPALNANLNENTVSETDELHVFTSVSDLFVTIFQRNTKQLYVCAPSVTSLLHCMLCHAMNDSQVASRQSVTIRSQHVTRICELLVGHKDVYKKHVVGLVLVFISGIEQATLSLQCREALTPAIYFLLDCMSTFEIQQLNAQMNPKARILFRNIHQNYEKLHTYKGQ